MFLVVQKLGGGETAGLFQTVIHRVSKLVISAGTLWLCQTADAVDGNKAMCWNVCTSIDRVI